MLTALSIRDLVLIDKLDVRFSPGLCVLTGETGAGKSILLDALGLALGSRGDSNFVRQGADSLNVTAEFDPPRSHPAFTVLANHNFSIDEGTLIFRRIVASDGRSRAYINDRSCSVGLLRSVGACLVEIHGQFETQGLLQPSTHLAVLDSYLNSQESQDYEKTCTITWASWQAATERLLEVQKAHTGALEDEEFLRTDVNELELLAPQLGEENDLVAKRVLLRSSEQIVSAMEEARIAISETVHVENALQRAQKVLQKVAHLADGKLDNVCAALERATIETDEALSGLVDIHSNLSVDPTTLERAEERLFELRRLSRKHKVPIDELSTKLVLLSEQLTAIDIGGQEIERLEDKARAARESYVAAAKALTKNRIKAAKGLDQRVAKELLPLKLEAATFRTEFILLTESAWGPKGVDKVLFEVSTNPDMPPGPLNKIASGGELARFMLALKVVLANTQPETTMIFDEVDAGVGGSTANAVGARLARLAKKSQVLVITHSPQVAALANHHWRVAKTTNDNGATTVKIYPLKDEGSREEIARMLAGASITKEARAAAKSLMGGTKK